MMNHVKITTALATLGLGLGVAGCSGGNGSVVLTPPPIVVNAKYVQIERLSRPAIKEVFEPFQDHQKSNAVEPYADPTILADISTTEDAVRYGGAPAAGAPDYGKALAGILYPDEYAVNLAGATPAGNDPEYFLSDEVEKAFGGRAPNDDVIDLELGILFGNTIPALGLAPDDHKENTCLSSQNIAGGENASKMTTGAFPYLPVPH